MIDVSQAEIGMVVYYCRDHMFHPARGVISSLESAPECIRVKFDGEITSKSCEPKNLYSFTDPFTIVNNDVQDEPAGGPINHPKHYNANPSGVEAIDIIEHMSFNIGNAIKYLWRADHKEPSLEDMKNSIWHIEREIHRRQKI